MKDRGILGSVKSYEEQDEDQGLFTREQMAPASFLTGDIVDAFLKRECADRM